MTYSKSDVGFHTLDGPYSPQVPAINVKVYHYPDVYDVMDHFGCTEQQAEKALEYAYESAQDRFWRDLVPDLVGDILAPHFGNCEAFSSGRSGGWLVVKGISDGDRYEPIRDWNAIDLAKWRKFERIIKEEIKYLCSWEYVKEDIEANRWAEEGAEQYNFFEFSDGHSECFVDMKANGTACPHCAYVLAA